MIDVKHRCDGCDKYKEMVTIIGGNINASYCNECYADFLSYKNLQPYQQWDLYMQTRKKLLRYQQGDG